MIWFRKQYGFMWCDSRFPFPPACPQQYREGAFEMTQLENNYLLVSLFSLPCSSPLSRFLSVLRSIPSSFFCFFSPLPLFHLLFLLLQLHFLFSLFFCAFPLLFSLFSSPTLLLIFAFESNNQRLHSLNWRRRRRSRNGERERERLILVQLNDGTGCSNIYWCEDKWFREIEREPRGRVNQSFYNSDSSIASFAAEGGREAEATSCRFRPHPHPHLRQSFSWHTEEAGVELLLDQFQQEEEHGELQQEKENWESDSDKQTPWESVRWLWHGWRRDDEARGRLFRLCLAQLEEHSEAERGQQGAMHADNFTTESYLIGFIFMFVGWWLGAFPLPLFGLLRLLLCEEGL